MAGPLYVITKIDSVCGSGSTFARSVVTNQASCRSAA